MSIIGIGTDITDIRRIESIYTKSPTKFVERICTNDEINILRKYDNNLRKKYSFLAKRFAAKEALAKALGTGIGKNVSFQDISISNDYAGKPIIKLSRKALQTAIGLTEDKKKPQIDLSLSDEYPMAIAFVVISTE